MSADRWSTCPRCWDTQHAKLVGVREEVQADYGKAEPEDFIKRLHDAQTALNEFHLEETFREDYEFYGAGLDEDGDGGGVLSVRYSGHCSVCGLDMKYKHDEPFYERAP